jgi:hypothetical protein
MYNNYYNDTHPLRPYTHSLPAMPGTLPPVNALRGESLPSARQGWHPAFADDAWIEIENHIGEEGWVNGVMCKIDAYGPLPDGWSDTPPEPSAEDLKEQRKAQIMARLSEIDLASVRPLRAIAHGLGTQADHDKLAALDGEAASLRTELAAFGQS